MILMFLVTFQNSLEKLIETSKTQQSTDDIAKEKGDFFADCLSLNCRVRMHMQGKVRKICIMFLRIIVRSIRILGLSEENSSTT